MTAGEAMLTLLLVAGLLLLLSASGAQAVADLCPMNASVPAPRDVRVDGDHLIVAGPPEISYPPDAYRPAPGGNGYVLCKCDWVKPCVRKCCAEDMLYFNKKCTKLNESLASSIRDFSVSPKCSVPNSRNGRITGAKNWWTIIKFACVL